MAQVVSGPSAAFFADHSSGSSPSTPLKRRTKVIHGTCGWSDTGAPWHKSGKTAAERLRSYSREFGFGCVEVDTTCYALKKATAIRAWAEATPKDFTFHVKVFGFFPAKGGSLQSLPRDLRRQVSPRKNPGPGLPTSPRRTQQNVRLSDLPETVTAELWRRFNAMLQPLVETKKMGAVLVQFHTSFGPSKANEDHVRYIRARLRKDVAMAVEFRNRKWLDTHGLGGSRLDRTCSLLADIKAVLVASDDLLHEVQQKDRNQRGLPKGSARVRLEPVLRDCVDQNSKSSLFDPPFAFCRVHRRHGTNRLLRSEELKDWSLKLNNFTGSGNPVKSTSNPHRGPIYFLWGTDHLDQPIRNRRALDSLLPKALRFDWRQHVRDTEATQPGTLLGMFAQATRNQISPGKSESKDRRIPKQSHVRSLTDPAAGPNKRKEKPCRQSNVPKRQKSISSFFSKK